MTTLVRRPAAGSPPLRAVRRSLAGLLTGAGEAVWVRPAFLGVVLLAAVLYVWDLTISGYANTYYSAAALAASKSWSAWFFGSFDAANFITVDKPPLATWVMGLSVRLFGLSPWSVLLPQALAGVATVAVLFVAVRRSFGPVAAVIAALVMALTPVAVLIFRYDNPDAMLTLLMVAGAWALLRALEDSRLRWVVLAAALIGFAFLTKYLQAYLVLPAFALVYLVAAVGSLHHRLVGLVVAAATVLVTSGWWVAIVEAIPTTLRPFIGGSTNDSVLDLIFGYDGLGRIFGATGPGGGGGGGFGGTAGLLRLFNEEFAGQISWFIPLALVGLGVGLVLRLRAPRTDRARAGYLLWGAWFAVNALVFSLMSGVIHPYYSVALAPAVAALVGAGLVDLWAIRSRFRAGGLLLAGALLLTAGWAWVLLGRTPDFVPGLAIAVAAVAVAAAVVVAAPLRLRLGRAPLVAASLGLVALLAGPTAYSLDAIGTAYGSGDPKAGPAAVSGPGTSGGGSFAGVRDGTAPGGTPPSGLGTPPSGFGTPPSGFGGAPGGVGGGSADSTLADYLVANKGEATWIVAVTSAQLAGSIELATGEPVMAMGGFMGSDPAPTLAELQQYVASGQLRYVIASGGGGGPGGSTSSDRTSWVTSACTVVDYGGSGSTLYDCAGAVS